MPAQNSKAVFEKAIAKLVSLNQRAFTRSVIYTLISVLVGGLWVTYSFYQVRKLNQDGRRIADELKERKAELERTKKEIVDVGTSLKKRNIDLDEALKANEELGKIKNSTADTKYRSSITIRYYEKPKD